MKKLIKPCTDGSIWKNRLLGTDEKFPFPDVSAQDYYDAYVQRRLIREKALEAGKGDTGRCHGGNLIAGSTAGEDGGKAAEEPVGKVWRNVPGACRFVVQQHRRAAHC